MEQTVSKKKTFLAGIISENPILVAILGTCPTLATTKSIESALGMGILVILTLIGSNVLISLLRKVIPSQVKIPCYIIIIATFVTIIKMLCQAFVPALYQSLGVFISLIVVNCIILGRAEAFASKNTVSDSFIDAIGQGLGFTIGICVIAAVREIIGTGAITIGEYLPLGFKCVLQFIPSDYTISIFTQPTGGFLVFGCVLGVLAWKRNHAAEAKAREEKARIEELKAKKAQELAAKKALDEAEKATKPADEVKTAAASEVKVVKEDK